jgi:hypothetical protein
MTKRHYKDDFCNKYVKTVKTEKSIKSEKL